MSTNEQLTMPETPDFPELVTILASADDEHAKAPFEEFSWALNSAHGQFLAGHPLAKLPASTVFRLGISGVVAVGRCLQRETRRKIRFYVEPVTGSMGIAFEGPMSQDNELELGGEEHGGLLLNARSAKVPRPPNAFIIYRKERHPIIARENPNLHNNSISVILGRKWQEEPDNVKRMYKEKAEHLKKQHAIDHPGYQYAPRKPSEKKKRTTRKRKTKSHTEAAASDEVNTAEQLSLPQFPSMNAMTSEHLSSNFAEATTPTPNSMFAPATVSSYPERTVFSATYMLHNNALGVQSDNFTQHNIAVDGDLGQPASVNDNVSGIGHDLDPAMFYSGAFSNQMPVPNELPINDVDDFIGADLTSFDPQNMFGHMEQISQANWDTAV